MIKWSLALVISGALLAQGPPQPPPSPDKEWLQKEWTPPGPERVQKTFGWTKANLYLARASERPFRIFLDPELTDTAPQGLYLPEWEQIYPAPDNYKFGDTKWLIQSYEVREEGDLIGFYLLREDQHKRKGYLGWEPYDQWFCVYDKRMKNLRTLRWALFDSAGEPLEIKNYAPAGSAIEDNGPVWSVIKSWVAGAPERDKAKFQAMINANKKR